MKMNQGSAPFGSPANSAIAETTDKAFLIGFAMRKALSVVANCHRLTPSVGEKIRELVWAG
jgi:hypothetical protein